METFEMKLKNHFGVRHIGVGGGLPYNPLMPEDPIWGHIY